VIEYGALLLLRSWNEQSTLGLSVLGHFMDKTPDRPLFCRVAPLLENKPRLVKAAFEAESTCLHRLRRLGAASPNIRTSFEPLTGRCPVARAGPHAAPVCKALHSLPSVPASRVNAPVIAALLNPERKRGRGNLLRPVSGMRD